jgi:hypothetical protein
MGFIEIFQAMVVGIGRVLCVGYMLSTISKVSDWCLDDDNDDDNDSFPPYNSMSWLTSIQGGQ